MMWKRYWPYILATLCVIGGASEFYTGYRGIGNRYVQSLEVPHAISRPAFSEREIGCLTRVVYNESRNQPRIGQRAVAAVVINRALSPRWRADNLCKIAQQPAQFYWSVAPHPRNPIDAKALVVAEEVARYVTSNYGALDEKMRSYVFFNSGRARAGADTIKDHNFYSV